jgi:protein-tyrosine phosphatase
MPFNTGIHNLQCYTPAFSGACPFTVMLIFAGMKILMVCLGNICRSPLAEGILQDKAFKAGLNWSVESAGTNSYHTGEPPHLLSQKVARLNGIDICHQRARRFVAGDFDVYDRIYALAGDVMREMQRIAGKKFDPNKVALLLDDLYPGEQRDVPDPWYGPEPGYHEAWDLINRACDAILANYTNNRKPAQSATTHE